MDTNKIIFCYKCGTKNEASSKFCQNCGINISEESLSNTQSREKNENIQPNDVSIANQKHLRKKGLIIVTVFFLIIILGVVFLVSNREKPKTPVEFMKGTYYYGYSDRLTVSEAFDNYKYLENVIWENATPTNHKENEYYVNVSGYLTYTDYSGILDNNNTLYQDYITVQFCIYKPAYSEYFDSEVVDIFFVNADGIPTYHFSSGERMMFMSDMFDNELFRL